MRNFIFSDSYNLPATNTFFVAHIENPRGKVDLLQQLSRKLRFPLYFGSNWDALYDCLRDFDWISEKEIVILHTKLPVLKSSDIRTYLEILKDSMNDWQEGENHVLTIVFPKKSEAIIEEYLTDES